MRRAPSFWRRGRGGAIGWILAPFGWIYGAITARRMRKRGWQAPVPVISIGNFTAGGAGKTPTTIAIVRALIERGEKPFVLSRGYGGRLAGPVRVEAVHAAADVGDEPLLLARVAPVIVARDRVAGARLAVNDGATCLVLDDALQNPALVKDFSLAVIDGGFGLGNEAVLPAGPLRAPLDRQVPHVDAMLLIGEDNHDLGLRLARLKPLLRARLVPDEPAAALRGRRVLAYSGIGLPEKFIASLAETGAVLAGRRDFPDHHAFTDAEASALLAEAGRLDAVPVTTEKDAMRLAGTPALEALRARSLILGVTLAPEAGLMEAVYRAIDSRRSRSSTASGPA